MTLLHVPARSAGPVRFGPGIDTQEQRPETTAERIWRSGRGEPGGATRATRATGRGGRASRSRRWRTLSAAALFAVIMAGAVLAWFKLSDAPDLVVASAEVKAAKKSYGCDGTALLTATVVTNGAPGEIAYEWHKNLDKDVVRGTLQTRSGQTSYQLPLRWSLHGKSTAKATATLRILAPGPARTAKASFTYKC
ncbi:hypothetical protein MF672_001740 [Actinomadura sp. ATCC 31491]|uniref:Ig-like domain-containing protein n=1 Tax=Actinomadura luzonensis TaxID=2805427 RepID=A0ABT0FJQ1_9ACTN|nr:hypothetical protein [Actinomadura luzonensis]MCK2212528.1 hypothetical protein [Actinomadura luzonensis]